MLGRLNGVGNGALGLTISTNEGTHLVDQRVGAAPHRSKAEHRDDDGTDRDHSEEASEHDPHRSDTARQGCESQQEAADAEDDREDQHGTGERIGSTDEMEQAVDGTSRKAVEVVESEPIVIRPSARHVIGRDGIVVSCIVISRHGERSVPRQTAGVNTDDAVASTTHLIDPEARDAVTVAGADALTYLQSQIAQEIRDLAIDAARWTLVLDPTGKIDALARITRTADDAFVLDTDAGFGEGLVARINRFKIRVDADVQLTTASTSEPSPEHEAARIGAGWPRMGSEIEPGATIPATTGVTNLAVNFTKGCYPGQELVERMDSRGADAPKTLRVVDLEQGSAVGDAVWNDGAEVGTVTSVAPDGGVGLAYIKRGNDIGRVPAHLEQ